MQTILMNPAIIAPSTRLEINDAEQRTTLGSFKTEVSTRFDSRFDGRFGFYNFAEFENRFVTFSKRTKTL